MQHDIERVNPIETVYLDLYITCNKVLCYSGTVTGEGKLKLLLKYTIIKSTCKEVSSSSIFSLSIN